MRVARTLFIIFVFLLLTHPARAVTLTEPVSGSQPSDTKVVLETIPGLTAIDNTVEKRESVLNGATVIDTIVRTLNFIAALGSNAQGEPVFKAPNLKKQSTIDRAFDPLTPMELQKTLWLPYEPQNLGGNELQPQLAGRGCITKSTTDTDKPLQGGYIGDPMPSPYPKVGVMGAVLSAYMGAIHEVDSQGAYVKNGVKSFHFETPKREVVTVGPDGVPILKDPSGSDLYPCNSNSEGDKIPEVDVKANGTLGSLSNPSNANVPQSNWDPGKVTLANFVAGLIRLGQCAVNNADPQCQEVLQGLGTSIQLTNILPFSPGMSCLTRGRCDDTNLPSDLPAEANQNLNSYKGWTNGFMPAKVQDDVAFRDGSTQQTLSVSVQSGAVDQASGTKKFPWRGVKGIQDSIDTTRDCMLVTKSAQKGKCTVEKNHVNNGNAKFPSDLTGTQPGVLGMEYLLTLPPGLISDVMTLSELVLLYQQRDALIAKYKIGTPQSAWPGSELADPARQAEIHAFAVQNNVNEAFLYSLWLEETHASSVGQFPFGCGSYGMNEFSASLNCTVNNTYTSQYMRNPLPEALCTYADGHYPCDFSAHPYFVGNLFGFYNYLTTP